jgi:hypothetical protein
MEIKKTFGKFEIEISDEVAIIRNELLGLELRFKNYSNQYIFLREFMLDAKGKKGKGKIESKKNIDLFLTLVGYCTISVISVPSFRELVFNYYKQLNEGKVNGNTLEKE